MNDPFVEVCRAKLEIANLGPYNPPRMCGHPKSVHQIDETQATAWPGECEECKRLGWAYSEHAYDGVMLERHVRELER